MRHLLELFLFFIVLMGLPDWYIFRTYVSQWKKKGIRILYWLPSILILIGMIYTFGSFSDSIPLRQCPQSCIQSSFHHRSFSNPKSKTTCLRSLYGWSLCNIHFRIYPLRSNRGQATFSSEGNCYLLQRYPRWFSRLSDCPNS